jgi:hypothetical protein
LFRAQGDLEEGTEMEDLRESWFRAFFWTMHILDGSRILSMHNTPARSNEILDEYDK